ncbi:hypothetical protein P170DRAFT_270945 [Aspergillus steynii IBT 23096]|uniref:Uncharacterized protein n=1 Tax=Aspergillus steynii IBT 23096 TaxID=1392250 RepID=A0A2I2FWI3_9EURO|nr:uncharacterized protein P170DRAFT_270945 [Aspergillus steynii IBT 23096]PLB44975.1 hypothetical protein P170DRAFT_270945 [Aspergillus steynii IBT 23096]
MHFLRASVRLLRTALGMRLVTCFWRRAFQGFGPGCWGLLWGVRLGVVGWAKSMSPSAATTHFLRDCLAAVDFFEYASGGVPSAACSSGLRSALCGLLWGVRLDVGWVGQGTPPCCCKDAFLQRLSGCCKLL